jgi:hypothetical protein
MGIVKGMKEKTDRKTLEEAVAAARAELAKRQTALAAAEESRTFAEAAAAAGSWSEKRNFRKAEEGIKALEDAVAEAQASLRGLEAELENYMAESAEAGNAASSRWRKAACKRAVELGRILAEKQAEELVIGKELVALVVEAEERAPKKLIARRSQRNVRVEVLDEALRGLHGDQMSMEFFAAKRASGKVRIIPSESLELRPEDVEYDRRSVPLPAELEAVRNINLGKPFPSGDAWEEFDFNRIEAMLSESEKKAAVAAVGEA